MISLHRSNLKYDGTHRYPTYGGRMIECRITIIEQRWNTVVIASDRSDSIYSSITLHTEELATTICESFGIDITRLLWIEHIPPSRRLGQDEDLFDLVHFEEQDGFLSRPYWTPLTAEEVEILTDGLLHEGLEAI